MPPEQFDDAGKCDKRSDIYSFGIVLYQMVSGGKLPFHTENNSQFFWQMMRYLHNKSAIPKIDSPLFPVIQHCLEKDPNKRYQSFAELRSDIERILRTQTREIPKSAKTPESSQLEIYKLGLSLCSLGKYHEGVEYLDKLIKMNPDSDLSIIALETKAMALGALKQYKDASLLCDRILKIKPRSTIALLIKGDIARDHFNQYEEAIVYYDEVLKIDTENVDAWNKKGNILQNYLEQYQESLYCYDSALQIDLKSGKIWNNKGNVLKKLGKYQEAIEAYQNFIKYASAEDSAHITTVHEIIRELERI